LNGTPKKKQKKNKKKKKNEKENKNKKKKKKKKKNHHKLDRTKKSDFGDSGAEGTGKSLRELGKLRLGGPTAERGFLRCRLKNPTRKEQEAQK